MKFEIPKPTQLLIDGMRAAADILMSVDMDHYESIHGGDDDLIASIDACANQLRSQAEEIQREQQALVDQIGELYDKRRMAEPSLWPPPTSYDELVDPDELEDLDEVEMGD
jgi:hypothetical protein